MRVILTGSSTGIGRALAERLLVQGTQVWGLARTDQSEFVRASGGLFSSSQCDVGVWEQVAQAAQQVAQAWTGVDAIITCAGVQGEVGRTLGADPVRWSATVRANLDGTFHALRAFHPLLQQAERRAKIVCFSGGGATKPRPNFSAYGSAKTAIVRLVETIAEEERGRPLDINAIAPGAINTRLTDEVLALGPSVAGDAEYQVALKQKASGGASLDKALALVEWLLSPSSDGITGKLISAQWDPWKDLQKFRADLQGDIYTLRRIVPEDRGRKFTT